MGNIAAIVVSAGVGQRMGTEKTFLNLGGKPLISWSVDILQQNKLINEIVLVLHKSRLDAGRELMVQREWSKVICICAGGNLRQDSVKNGLQAVKDCEWLIIHDGARPFLTDKLLNDGIEVAMQVGAAAAAVEMKDTVKQVDDSGIVLETLYRNRLRIVQTPQVFRLEILKKAYDLINSEVTDDSSIVELAGFKVKLYPGDYENIKITTPDDMMLAEIIARGR